MSIQSSEEYLQSTVVNFNIVLDNLLTNCLYRLFIFANDIVLTRKSSVVLPLLSAAMCQCPVILFICYSIKNADNMSRSIKLKAVYRF